MIITEKPDGLPGPENALDGIDPPPRLVEPAQIIFGNKALVEMQQPPAPGEFIKIELTLRCRSDGRDLLDDGGYVHFRRMKMVAAKVIADPYRMDEDEDDDRGDDLPPGLFDTDGEPSAEATGDEPRTIGEIIDERSGDDFDDEYPGDNHGRPAFSDGGE